MKRSRGELIGALAADLQPVSRPGRIAHRVALWLAVSWTYTVLIVSVTGPWRAGFTQQLVASPQFLAESLLGLATGAALIVAALRLGIPDSTHPLRRSVVPLVLAACWAGSYVLGLWHPALDPSMLGKREHCSWEAMVYSLPPLLAGLVLLRGLLPLHPRISGALLGLAAGALPALAMQFACMYTPGHSLSFHLAPALAIAVLGALIAPVLLTERSRAPI